MSASFKGNRNSLHVMITKQTAVMLTVGESLQLNANLILKGKTMNKFVDRGSTRNAYNLMNTIAVESHHPAVTVGKMMPLIRSSIKILKTSTKELYSSKRKRRNYVGWVPRKGTIMWKTKRGATTARENATIDRSGMRTDIGTARKNFSGTGNVRRDHGMIGRGMIGREMTDRGTIDNGTTDHGTTDFGMTDRGTIDQGMTDSGMIDRVRIGHETIDLVTIHVRMKCAVRSSVLGRNTRSNLNVNKTAGLPSILLSG